MEYLIGRCGLVPRAQIQSRATEPGETTHEGRFKPKEDFYKTTEEPKTKTYSDPHLRRFFEVCFQLHRSLLVKQWESFKTCQ